MTGRSRDREGMSEIPPEEDFPIFDPLDDPESFEPKPIYTEPNEDFEEDDDA